MSDRLLISILSDDDNYDIPLSSPLERSVAQPSSPTFPKNTHKNSLSEFFTKKTGFKWLSHKPNVVQTRSGNGYGIKYNSKESEVGKKITN